MSVKRYGSDSQQTIKQALYSFAVDAIPVNKPKRVKTVKNMRVKKPKSKQLRQL